MIKVVKEKTDVKNTLDTFIGETILVLVWTEGGVCLLGLLTRYWYDWLNQDIFTNV